MLAQNKTMFHSFINIEAINQEKINAEVERLWPPHP
jgi:hypothetical protein